MSTIDPNYVVPTGTWTVDPAHSTLGFSVKHMKFASVHGEFTDYSGGAKVTKDLLASRIHATIQIASVDTSEDQRDEFLRSAEFFDPGSYPEMTYASTRIEAIDDDNYRIFGELTLRGITKEIVLVAEINGVEHDAKDIQKVSLTLTGELSRKEYGIKFSQAHGGGDKLVDDKVKLALEITIVHQSPQRAAGQ